MVTYFLTIPHIYLKIYIFLCNLKVESYEVCRVLSAENFLFLLNSYFF